MHSPQTNSLSQTPPWTVNDQNRLDSTFDDILLEHLTHAPVSLAIERSIESYLLSKQKLIRPVLDLGCGDGLFASLTFKDPIDVGCDLSFETLKHNGLKESYRLRAQSTAYSLPYLNNRFNTIVCNSTLEHIKDTNITLSELNRVLTTNGLVFITVPCHIYETYSIGYQILAHLKLTAAADKYARFYNKFWKHYRCYPSQEWESLFAKAGFKVVDCRAYGSPQVCLLYHIFLCSAWPAVCTKKLFKRWILSSRLRKWYIQPWHLLLRKFIMAHENTDSQKALLFYVLRK